MKNVVDRRASLRSPCSVVNSLRTSSISRCLVAAVMMFSWLVVTNHCAMGLMSLAGKRTTAMHAHCHASSGDDSKQTPGEGMRECCRTIKASLPGEIEVPGAAWQIHAIAYALVLSMLAPATEPAPEFFWDHGPPHGSSFAEIVLQRSLLSHAPPYFA